MPNKEFMCKCLVTNSASNSVRGLTTLQDPSDPLKTNSPLSFPTSTSLSELIGTYGSANSFEIVR